MADPMRARIRIFGATVVILGYPYLVYRGMDSGMVWIAPLLVSFFYIVQAFGNRRLKTRVINVLIGGTLLASVILLKSGSAKFLPVLVQVILCWFFVRSLFKGPPLIECFVRLDFAVFPPGIAQYCRQLTWMWTLFFAFNGLVCSALALWANDAWWAFYTGVVINLLTGVLLAGEYCYRHYRFPGLKIPDPQTSFRSILINSRKIWMDLHAR